MNLDPATKHGEIIVMLPPGANRLHTAPLVAAMKERMASYAPDDMLVAVGDPTLIAAASVIAARASGGRLRILKWDRMRSDYILTELAL